MDLFSRVPLSIDYRSRGFTALLRGLLAIGVLAWCLAGVILGISWLTGSQAPPAALDLPGRGGGGPVPYSVDLAWLIVVASAICVPLCRAGIVQEISRARRAFTSRRYRVPSSKETPFRAPTQGSKHLLKKRR